MSLDPIRREGPPAILAGNEGGHFVGVVRVGMHEVGVAVVVILLALSRVWPRRMCLRQRIEYLEFLHPLFLTLDGRNEKSTDEDIDIRHRPFFSLEGELTS